MFWMPTLGFWRRKEVAPAEGSFDVAAVARVEPLGQAPTTIPGATFAPTAVATLDMIGAIPPVPAAPTGNAIDFDHTVDGEGFITAVDGSADQTWTNNDPGATDTIRVEQATNVNFTQNVVDQELAGSATSTTWTNQKDGVTRFYRVRSENGSGNSAWSNVVSVKHIEDVPGVAQNLDATSPTPTSITVTWDAPATGGPVDHYIVESLEGFPDQTTGSLATTFSGLDPATAYAFRVRAIGPDNQAGDRTAFIIRATRHPEPDLDGCADPDPVKPEIETYRLLIDDNAASNTNIKIFRNGSLYDTVGAGDQTYTPTNQSGSWHVTAAGGSTGHVLLGGGSTPIPESDESPTRTMPFSGPCAQ